MSHNSDWTPQINSTTDSICPQHKLQEHSIGQGSEPEKVTATNPSFLQQFCLEQPTNNTATAPSCHNSELPQVAQVSLDTGALQQTGETTPQQQKLQVNSDPKFWLGDLKAE